MLAVTKIVFGQVTCDMRIADSLEFNQLEAEMLMFHQKPLGESCQTLRVVVHVVYDGSIASGYYRGQISPEQVKSQIRITNQFLANDSLMESEDNHALGYQLELATTDPNGNPTTGIIYHNGVSLFGSDWHNYGLKNTNADAISANELSGTIGWGADADGKKYLNTYVVSSIDGNTGGGVQAFAYFPTANSVFGNYNLFNAFGAQQLQDEYGQDFDLKTYTDLGLTYTHELLHNFALFHTFQGNSCAAEINSNVQGDRVTDTPPQTQGSGCSGSCGFVSYNVMDYLSQTCKNRITPGQVSRADLAIQSSLSDYLVCNTACNPGNGDFNNDGTVNLYDLSLFSSHFGSLMGSPQYDAAFDLNCDGMINVLDVTLILLQ